MFQNGLTLVQKWSKIGQIILNLNMKFDKKQYKTFFQDFKIQKFSSDTQLLYSNSNLVM